MRPSQPSPITSAQAHYVVQRLIVDRRLSLAEIASHLADLPAEIQSVEARLASLRAIVNGSPTVNSQPSRVGIKPRTGRRTAAKRKAKATPSEGRALHGRYIGYLRQFAEPQRIKYKAMAARDGKPLTIERMRKALRK
jgi:hypothetical protein